MNILQFGKYTGRDGGIETHVRSLASGLAETGAEVTVLGYGSEPNRRAAASHYRVVQVPLVATVAGCALAPRLGKAAKRLHAQQAFDVVHLHFPDPMSHLASLSIPPSVPRIITWHSDIIRQQWLGRLYRPWLLSALKHAAAIVVATDAHIQSSAILRGLTTTPARIIPYGFDLSRFECKGQHHEQIAAIRARARGRPILFALGRHVPYKGFGLLLEAVQHTEAYLVLGGQGPETPMLKARAHQLNISERVEFTGSIAEDQLPAFYHACDLYCLSSTGKNEAFGIVQIEAMASGKPAVCFQLDTGVNDICLDGVTGRVVTAHCALAYAQAINELLTDHTERKRLGEQAKQSVFTHYTGSAMVEAHLALYARCLSLDPSRPGRP